MKVLRGRGRADELAPGRAQARWSATSGIVLASLVKGLRQWFDTGPRVAILIVVSGVEGLLPEPEGTVALVVTAPLYLVVLSGYVARLRNTSEGRALSVALVATGLLLAAAFPVFLGLGMASLSVTMGVVAAVCLGSVAIARVEM
jgi:hypothetical protein